MREKIRFLLPILIIVCAIPGTAAAQTAGGQRNLTFVNSLGDILQKQTPSQGKIHLHGGIDLTSADYFRGVFDGVPEDGDWALQPALGMTVELGDLTGNGMDLNLTLGLDNGFSDDEPFDNVGNPELWYAADGFAGLTARLSNGLMGALTYTIYSVPNDIFDDYHELAFTAGYGGSDAIGGFQPTFKVGLPVHEGSGLYLEAGVKPDIEKIFGVQMPFRTFVPLTVGVGLNEYYEDEFGMYGSAGLAASLPLDIGSDYGNWSLDGSLTLLLRRDELEDLGEPYDNGGNTVMMGTVGVSFVY